MNTYFVNGCHACEFPIKLKNAYSNFQTVLTCLVQRMSDLNFLISRHVLFIKLENTSTKYKRSKV